MAVLWQLALAHVHRVWLLPGMTAGLALIVWLVYAADRTIDAFGGSGDGLSRRHAFYRRNAVLLLVVLMPAVAMTAGHLALYTIPEGLLWQCVALGMLMLLYVACYPAHGLRWVADFIVSACGIATLLVVAGLPMEPALKFGLSMLVIALMSLALLRQISAKWGWMMPKELAGGVLFALGTTAGIRFFASVDGWSASTLEVLLLAWLFSSNLIGISISEAGHGRAPEPAGMVAAVPGIRKIHPWLLAVGVGCGLVLWHSAQGSTVPPVLGRVALVFAAAMALLLVVHLQVRRLSADLYRVLADLVLVLPLPLVWW